MAKFYVSSTYEDLKECRQSVCETLRRLNHEVVGMENYTADSSAPLDKCLRDVASCDNYVGIFAWRYGYVPGKGNPKRKSITELEYLKAREENKELLIFLLDDKAPWPGNLTDKGEQSKKVEALREQLKTDHTVKFFRNEHDLAVEVSLAVNALAVESRRSQESTAPEEQDGPRPDRPVQPVRTLLATQPFWKRHAKVLLVALVLLVVAVPAAYFVKLRYWPPAYSKERVYDFYLSDKLGERWDFPEGQWSLEKGEGRSPNSGALLVKSARMGMPNDLEGKVFYDYRADFKVRFKEGNRVAWVLRAQRDGRSGYLFEIECKGGTLFLNGWLLKGDRKAAKLDGDKEALRYSKCCDPTDGLHVVVDIVGNHFDYKFTFESDPRSSNAETGREESAKFEDSASTFGWGSFGFLETDDASWMKIEYLYLTPLQSGPAPPASTPGRSS